MRKAPKKTAARKRPAKKHSKLKTDALRAFQLVCLLIIVSVCVSFAVIIGYNKSKRGAASPEQARIAENARVNEVAEQTETPQISSPPSAPQPASAGEQPKPAAQNDKGQTSAAGASGTASAGASNAGAVSASRLPTAAKKAEQMGNIAFVIDDAGNNLQDLEPFLRIEGPLTIAVMPGLPHSKEAAKRIRAAGKEVILHQPMEAVGGQNPGPGAIYANMSAEEVRRTLEKNMEEVGPVAGMNNHQGSKITQDRAMMEVILAFCKENNIYFLDSRTTAETAAPAAALRLGVKIAERDAFLDNEPDKESMQRYLTSGLARAQRNGSSIMIGHTQSKALAPFLAEQYPVLIIQGYTIKTVSELLK